MKPKIILFLFLITSITSIFGQDPFSVRLNQSNGLPSNNVYNVFEDSEGFIWFTTDEGLTRYDGFEYKSYNNQTQSTNAGSCIKQDKFGKIWYENFDGQLFYIQNNKLRKLSQARPIGYHPFGLTRKHIFALTQNGIDVYDLKSLKKIKTFKINKAVTSGADDGTNYFYMIGNTVYRINENLQISSKVLNQFSVKGQNQIFAEKNLVIISARNNETKTIYTLNSELELGTEIALNTQNLINNINYIDNTFFINTVNGTFLYNRSGKSLATFYPKENISSIIRDRQKNFWFCTTNNGVSMVSNLESKVYPYPKTKSSSIINFNDNFIIGSKGGELASFNTENITQKTIHKSADQSEIYYIFRDSLNGNLFYSANGTTFLPPNNSNKSIHLNIAVKNICRIDQKYYAVAASGFAGIMLLPNTNKFQPSVWDTIFKPAFNANGIEISHLQNNIRAKTIAFNNVTNSIYFSGNQGTFKRTLTQQKEITKNNKPYFTNKIIAYKNFLISLNYNGELFKITNDKEFEQLNDKINENEVKLIKQFKNYLLVVGKQTIHKLNLDNLEHQMLNIPVNTREINDIAINDSYLLILADNGVIKADLKSFERKNDAVKFHINYFKLGDKQFDKQQTPTVDYKQKDLTINYSILDYSKSAPKNIYYKVNGGTWKIAPKDGRTIQFIELSSGKYNVAFKFDNQHVKDMIHFEIEAPFWRTWWFTLLAFSIVSALGLWYYGWHIRLLKKQINLLNDKVELEQNLAKSTLTAIRSQMNPHFFYNALNTIQAYIFTNDKRNASLYLGKFSKLTRMILEMSENELINLEEEIQALTLYLELEKIRFDDEFNFSIQTNKVDVEMIKIPPMLIQPLVENGIKHGLLHKTGAKNIEINFFKEGDFLKVIVEDNGVGRKYVEDLNKLKKHKSFAIKANQQRLEVLNMNRTRKVLVNVYDKIDHAQSPAGTIVVIFIPIN